MKMKRNSMKWSWIFFVAFFVLALFDIRFAAAGFLCMIAPLYQAIRGRGKIHCSRYCPRGSFLKKWLPYMTINMDIPQIMRGHFFRNIVLVVMAVIFGVSLYCSHGNAEKISAAVFRLVTVSSVIALFMGIFFKPRTWCTICPMGHITGMISRKKITKYIQ